ncbi:MAG: cupin domain-containing protein [SAR202 cluster bacterium]|jgi:quercetin dioxygenase-like cupin family protein|nr:cupin domain-containing protein [SAR202 cluster bacterium]|tara:strand:- start:1317 stop:1712 length:396 start_codon:yes stop_codon:yes gene_type:complete
MPIYKAAEMKLTPDVVNPNVMMMQFGGELIKAGIVTYEEGEVPLPHVHPNDEQWIYLLEGQLAGLIEDDVFIIEPGDLVYIPINHVHGIRLLESPCRFFTCKSPAGSGNLSEDYNALPNVEELIQRLTEVS